MSSVPLLIAGDFNIHVDVPGNADSVCLKELLKSMGLQQHVNVPMHESRHTLDLIITRQCDSFLVNIPVADCLFSDHFTLICDLTLDKPPLPKKKISFRKTNMVDVNLLCDELSITSLCTDSPDTLILLNVTTLHYLRLLIVMLHLSLSLSQSGLLFLGLVTILGSQGGRDGELKENGVDLDVSAICLNLK